MIVTRLVSLILRAAQFVFAVIVLGLTAYFLHERLSHGVGPLGRVIYTVIWSSLSIIFSIIWMIPTKSTIASYGSDLRTFLTSPLPPSLTTLTPPLVFTAGWAAAFGVLVRYFNTQSCGSAWAWTGFSLRRSNACGQWKAAQAFSFLSLVVWFATFVLGVITYHRLSRQPVVNEGPGKGFGRRSRV
jgi:hypothetical protein